jgi:hypothetical protein
MRRTSYTVQTRHMTMGSIYTQVESLLHPVLVSPQQLAYSTLHPQPHVVQRGLVRPPPIMPLTPEQLSVQGRQGVQPDLQLGRK